MLSWVEHEKSFIISGPYISQWEVTFCNDVRFLTACLNFLCCPIRHYWYIILLLFILQKGTGKSDIVFDWGDSVPYDFSEADIPEHKRTANWVLDVDGELNQYYSVDSKGQICLFKDGSSRSIKVSWR